MNPGGNTDEDPAEPSGFGPIDAWEAILRGIAEDVHHMRSMMALAVATGWLITVLQFAILIK